MTENEKRDVAVFRYSIISDVVNGRDLSWGEQERLIREKCLRKWSIPFSEKTRISRGSVLNWIKAYKNSNGDIRSLYPRSRKDKGKSRAMDEDTCLGLLQLRKQMPAATVPILMDEMIARGLVTPGIELKSSTVYRFLNQHGMMRQKRPAEDRRKFEAPGPNELWQSDVMHGPRIQVDGKLRKTYLIAIIDDHSRLIPHGEFYLSEGLPSYLNALEQAFLKRGLPMILAGQANLIDKMTYRTSAPMASRIIARSHMEGMNLQSMQQYLVHHLRLAGIETNFFEDPAVIAIHQGSGGLPRKANHLARGALIAAASNEAITVTPEHVRLAATEIF